MVTPTADADDGVRVGNRVTQQTPVNTKALAEERTPLRLVTRDAAAAIVQEIDRLIDSTDPPPVVPLLRGEVEEYDHWSATDVTLTRYTTRDGAASLHTIPASLLTPRVRGRLYDLLVALDEAAATRSVTRA
jgi:hypothetical protein